MRVNEIFQSLQGEGCWTGAPAVFLRLSGCNHRCSFCDTRHETFEEMTEEEIVKAITNYPAPIVVVTGGEPSLQLTKSLVDKIHAIGKRVHLETNGTIALSIELTEAIDWITLSPKSADTPAIGRFDELKVVFTGDGFDPSKYERFKPTDYNCRFLQPCDVKDSEKNKEIINQTIDYIKQHPIWRLYLQTHKLIDIP